MPTADTRRFARQWTSRVRSPRFRRQLTTLVADEIRAAARMKVKEVVDARRVRRLLEQADPAAFDADVLTDLVLEANRTVRGKLRSKRKSLRGLLDAELSARLDALLDEPIVLSRHAEEFIGQLMQTELVRDLFTDVVHTSIVSFNKRVNPIFGGVTMAALEPQIRGFIRLFMPMIQKQATTFVVDQRNQAMFADFAASIARELSNEPLPSLLDLVSVGGRSEMRALVRDLVGSPRLQALNREMTLAVWDRAFAQLRGKAIGEIVALDENAERIAAEVVKTLLPALVRPRVVELLAREVALAAR